jgi:hypothetical protein
MHLSVEFSRDAISIQRTSNGWLIHTWTPRGLQADATRCLAVAESPERLAEIVTKWAVLHAVIPAFTTGEPAA